MLDEFGAQIRVGLLAQRLQQLLLLNGTHDRMAVTVLEELSNEASDSIFGFNCVAHTILLLQRPLKVVLLSQGIALGVFEA